MFSPDSALMQILNRLADLILINLLTVAGVLPLGVLILTLTGFFPVNALTVILSILSLFYGPAVTAMHYCLIRMVRGEDAYTLRSYFHSYKDNFVQASLLGTALLAACLLIVADLTILRTADLGGMNRILSIICGAVLTLLLLMSLYLFPLQARFENRLRATVKNALLIAIYAFPRTLLMVFIYVALAALIALFSLHTVPFLLMAGFSVPAYLCARLYVPVFKRFEPDEESGNS